MLTSMAQWMAAWCLHYSGVPGDQEVIAYGLECRMADALQALIVTLAGIGLGKPLEMLCCCLCFASLKQQVGGSHAPNHFWCITGFTAFAVWAVKTATLLPYPVSLLVGGSLVLGNICILVLLKPIPHSNHPKSYDAIRSSHRKAKRIGLIQAVGVLLGAVLFPHQSFWMAGALGGGAAALSLYIVWAVKRPQERRENHGKKG